MSEDKQKHREYMKEYRKNWFQQCAKELKRK